MKKINIILITLLIVILLIPIYLFFYSNIQITKSHNIRLNNNTIYLESMSVREKIAQMIIVRGDNRNNLELMEFNIGGIFLDRENSENEYASLISEYQNKSQIRLFVSTDLEGSWNPFKGFLFFPNFSDINSSEEAYSIGKKHGEILKKLGFNINFAPVAEFSDQSYGGRTFSGNKSQIINKISNYILGLQENVLGTCKHYPGKGLIKNLHDSTDQENITSEDLLLFHECIKNNISAILIGHQMVYGEIDSKGKPSSISKEVISSLNDFNGLIISDEINMHGLSSSYKIKSDMYADLINSGENVILDFDMNKKSLSQLLDKLESMVNNGSIKKENIDSSVRKILVAKGYKVL